MYAWGSETFFAVPRAALIREVPDFPYIRRRADEAFFREMERLEQEARELCTFIEAVTIGHPLAVGFWFECANRDLDYTYFASAENDISYSRREITPFIANCTALDMQAFNDDLRQYKALPKSFRSKLLRSMNRFTLSQCRHQMVDRVLDLALAFEIAVSGGRGDNAPPSWKVSVRSTQLIGGGLENRQDNRRKIADLYSMRNQGTHGSILKNFDQARLQETAGIYRALLRSCLRHGKEPDWHTLDLQPAFW
jgi:hypothetical protein